MEEEEIEALGVLCDPFAQLFRGLVQGFGFRVSRSGIQVPGLQGSGFGVRGSGSGVRGPGFGVRGPGFGVRSSGSGFRVLSFGVEGSEEGSYLRLIDFCITQLWA